MYPFKGGETNAKLRLHSLLDQLWLWIINSAFPQGWDKADTHEIIDTKDVLDSVLDRLKQKERNPVTSVFDLAELIKARCMGLNSDSLEWEHERYRYLEIFEYSINHVADEEIRNFNDFAVRGKKSHQEEKEREEQEEEETTFPKQGKRRSEAPRKETEDFFDITSEVELMREIKDIRDELHTLGNLFEQQRQVIEQFTRLIGEARMAETTDLYSADTAVLPAASLSSAIQRHIKYVKSMEDNANIPYHALEDLLDLKQKQANVFEARTARVSGNTVTVFTIVAIIFLPASFMAAFLALPITEYPSNNNNKIKLRYAI